MAETVLCASEIRILVEVQLSVVSLTWPVGKRVGFAVAYLATVLRQWDNYELADN